MESTSAAIKVQSFDWFKFKGPRTKSYENHNKNYDLDLEKGMVFGIRKMRTAYKLVLASDLDISFKLSEKEIGWLQQNSTSFAGKIKGVRIAKKEIVDDALYQDISIPPTKAELIKLYDHYNKKLFEGVCPAVTFSFTKSRKTIAWARYEGRGKVRMVFNRSTLINKKYVIDTLLHEMIHCYQYGLRDKYVLAGDHQSAAVVLQELLPIHRKGEAGHGDIFKKQMHRLNALGYTIDITEKNDVAYEAELDHYVLLMYSDEAKSLVGGYHSNLPFKEDLPALIKEIERINGPKFYHGYMYGKSDISFHNHTTELKKDNVLPRNVKLAYYRMKTDALSKFKPEVEYTVQDDPTTNAKLGRTIAAFNKLRYTTNSYMEYAVNVVHQYMKNTAPSNSLSGLDSAFHAGSPNRFNIELGSLLKQEEVKFIHDSFYKNIDTKTMLSSNTSTVKQLVGDVWYYHESNAEQRAYILKDIRGDIKNSPLSRLEKKEFKELLTQRIKRQYPIPAAALSDYLDSILAE